MPRHRHALTLALLGAVTSLGLLGCASRSSDAPSEAERQAARQARLAEVLPMPSAEQVDTLERAWVDAGRDRPVPVRLYLPRAAATPGERVPLVVVSHGIGGSRFGYSYLGRHLAAQGYAALHVQHVGSDNRLWRGSPWDLLERLNGAATEAEAIARAQDVRFALDQAFADSAIAARLDSARIAAVGHSYGANTALLVSGARVPGKPALADARVKAVVAISAPPFHGYGAPGPILGPIGLPALHVTAEDDDIRIPGFFSGVQDRVALYEAMGSASKRLVIFRDGSHSMFTDRLGTGGSEHNPAVKRATRELVVAFLDGLWRGRGDALDRWQGEHLALLSARVPASAQTALGPATTPR